MEILAKKLGELLEQRGYKLVTAESCTGGGLAQVVTAIAGSSRWFERGFVTYSNASKQELLGVKSETLGRHGAVSPETAQEMAEGALRRSHAQIAVAITGIAGPEGGTPLKPVGTVWLAWAEHGQGTRTVLKQFTGDRKAIRCEAIRAALEGLLEGLS